jgi:WXG100 family type VII secretion target
MAGQRYQATPEEMQRAAAQVAQVNEGIQAALARLRAEVASVATSWKGEAATSFGALMSRWDGDSVRLSQALSGIGAAIQSSGLGYQAAEDEQHRAMSQITSVLG